RRIPCLHSYPPRRSSDLGKGGFTPAKKFRLAANYPLKNLNPNFIQVKKDTLVLTYNLIRDSINPNAFTIDFPIELNSAYTIDLRSEEHTSELQSREKIVC